MKTNVLIGERMCSWMRAHEWEKETLNDQWTKWTNERSNDRSVCTFDWEKCWNNFDIAYSSLIMREKSRIYECIEFDIGDVEVMTSCTDNKNVLNRIVGWSTPIIDKKKKEKSEETYWKKKWKKSDETYYWEKKVFKRNRWKKEEKKRKCAFAKDIVLVPHMMKKTMTMIIREKKSISRCKWMNIEKKKRETVNKVRRLLVTR